MGAMNRRSRDSSDRRSKPCFSRALSSGRIGRTTTGVASRSLVRTCSMASLRVGCGFRRGMPASALAEEPGLLGLELVLGEHAVGAKLLELGQLVRHRPGRRRRGLRLRGTGPGHPRLVAFTQLVHGLLDAFGVADVREGLLAALPP